MQDKHHIQQLLHVHSYTRIRRARCCSYWRGIVWYMRYLGWGPVELLDELDAFSFGPAPCVSLAELYLHIDNLDLETGRQVERSMMAPMQICSLSPVPNWQLTADAKIVSGSLGSATSLIKSSTLECSTLVLQLCTTSVRGVSGSARPHSEMQKQLRDAEGMLMPDQFAALPDETCTEISEEFVRQPSLHRASEALIANFS